MVDRVSWGWRVVSAVSVGMLVIVNDSPVVATVSVKASATVGKMCGCCESRGGCDEWLLSGNGCCIGENRSS